MSAGIERHAKVSGPKGLINSRKEKSQFVKMFHSVRIGLKSEVAHLAQPKVHSLSSPISIFAEETPVSVNHCIESSSIRKNITIIH